MLSANVFTFTSITGRQLASVLRPRNGITGRTLSDALMPPIRKQDLTGESNDVVWEP